MTVYAVLDTNVVVSAFISKNPEAPTVGVMNAVLEGRITPLYHRDILAEYREVLLRPKFHLPEESVNTVLRAIEQFGMEVLPTPTGEILSDSDDLIFYEVTMEKRNDGAYLVTGNQKHFPPREYIVTPSEMMELLNQ